MSQAEFRARARRLRDARRLIVKVGSALLVDAKTGRLNRAWLETLADDLAEAAGRGQQLIVVSSGAIALGHPVGMSGARIVLHAALELKRRGGGIGAAALCGGGGQGDALIIRPLRDAHAERVRAAALRVADHHAAAFEKLAK